MLARGTQKVSEKTVRSIAQRPCPSAVSGTAIAHPVESRRLLRLVYARTHGHYFAVWTRATGEEPSFNLSLTLSEPCSHLPSLSALRVILNRQAEREGEGTLGRAKQAQEESLQAARFFPHRVALRLKEPCTRRSKRTRQGSRLHNTNSTIEGEVDHPRL